MCGRRTPRRVESQRTSTSPDLRASQAERDRVVDSLRQHAGEGRLDVEELEDRVERALTARTRGELDSLEADLPRVRLPRRSASPGIGRIAAALALMPLLAGIAVIVLAPAAVAWTGWVAVGWWAFTVPPTAGFGLALCGHSKRRRRRSAAAV